MSKPTVPEVLPLVNALYATYHGGAGGCLHIVLDDGNVKDEHVEYCIAGAQREGCYPCIELGRKLLQMSKTQRLKLGRLAGRDLRSLPA